MPELVINTGPIIGLTAALGDLKLLDKLYREVLISKEVYDELRAGGESCPELQAIAEEKCLQVATDYQKIPPLLNAELDRGEASVIVAAISQNVTTVAIDEKQGRRIARLHGIKVTGSLGILMKGKRLGFIPSLESCLDRMQAQGIWISRELREQALSNS